MTPDERAFLLDVALSDWAHWSSMCAVAAWRKKLNNFELSEVDAQFAYMDRALRDLVSVSQQRPVEAPNDGPTQSAAAILLGPPATHATH